MREENDVLNHLIRNLERISPEDSIFNYKSGSKAFVSLGQGNISEWLETFLPNTRIIVEPKIIGSIIGIQYINGELNKVINKNVQDITESVSSLKIIPKSLPIKNRLEIQGILYNDKNLSRRKNEPEFIEIQNWQSQSNRLKFCAFQIYQCNINHFQTLQELKHLNFEIPQTHFTNFISDIEIYLQCWREGKLFTSYPTNGLVLKINSRKLQKYLGENNLSIPCAYAIN
ncbi:hypothetical protein [Prochlorococcus sp. MIT 0801]|uniref:hypothetical protein n=1 Tax=Prochlorococcus sp. MIT 0801 TaxID=1501269 RepID=UPI0004F674E6|nr:hypothetical protein [Prochlorococcus sp. MIT 0801]AIQ97232.1 DNA ligase [Prochlorococcus sp. MIT 0801]